jgi:hypothetical protein
MTEPDPLDQAAVAFRQMPVPGRPPDDPLLAKMTAGPSPAAEPDPPSRRSLLMRITSWSLAASVLVVAGGVLLFSGAPSVALGDVIKAAEKHKLVKYRMTEATETKDGGAVLPNVSVAYADLKAPRFRTELRMPGHLGGAIDFESLMVQDAKKGVMMCVTTETVTPKGKTDPELVEMLKGFAKTGVPRKEVTLRKSPPAPAPAPPAGTILDNFRQLEKHKDAVATRGKMRGKDVLKYRIEEGNKTTVLWVDAVTKLPVRLEHEIENLTKDVQRMTVVMSDFEWDPELKGFKSLDELFSTAPPKGYKVTDLTKEDEKKADQPAPSAVPEKP